MVVSRQVQTPEHSDVGQSPATSYLSPVDIKQNSMWQRPTYNVGHPHPNYPTEQQQQPVSWNTLSSCRIEWFNDRNPPPPAYVGKLSKKKQPINTEEVGFYHRHPTKRAWSESSQRNWTPIQKNDADDSDATSGLLTLSNGVDSLNLGVGDQTDVQSRRSSTSSHHTNSKNPFAEILEVRRRQGMKQQEISKLLFAH